MTGNSGAERVRQCVRFPLPGNATSNEIVAVIIEGSDRSLELPVRETWEFPESSNGDAADRLRSGSDPIAQLEELRAKGARFLLVTDAASSWLAANSEFERHLDWNYRVVRREEENVRDPRAARSTLRQQRPGG
jgi:hypothetical protein